MESTVTRPELLWIAGPFLVAIGLVWQRVASRIRRRAKRTTGTIRSSGVEHVSGAWRPVINFDYELDGEQRSGNRVFPPPGRESGKHGWAQSIADEFSEGQSVTVRYDPVASGNAFLIDKPDQFWMIPFGLGLALTGLAAIG